MKKFYYYSSCVLTWLGSVLILALIYVVLSGVNTSICGWSYALGTGYGQPSIWITALGIVLLSRKVLYAAIMNEKKKFPRTVSIALIVIGLLWFVLSTVSQMKSRQMQEQIYDRYYNPSGINY